jgi:hypothetical protein
MVFTSFNGNRQNQRQKRFHFFISGGGQAMKNSLGAAARHRPKA